MIVSLIGMMMLYGGFICGLFRICNDVNEYSFMAVGILMIVSIIVTLFVGYNIFASILSSLLTNICLYASCRQAVARLRGGHI
ncbi:MAG: hypothetical protein GXO23_05340 [Crenarchaeota archaeon]|nr:hypothetical protein [Thermoproteota archaeon]